MRFSDSRIPTKVGRACLVALCSCAIGCAEQDLTARFGSNRREPLDPQVATVGEFIHHSRQETRYVSLRADGTARFGIQAPFGSMSFPAKWSLQDEHVLLSHPGLCHEIEGEQLGDSTTFNFETIDLNDAQGRTYRRNLMAPRYDRFGQLPHLYAAATSYAVNQERTNEIRGSDTSLSAQDANNLILISIDTLRADHVGCYGYPRQTTPALDRFAAQGVAFENCSAAAPWTLPSHASMLTGLSVQRHGTVMYETSLPAVPTLALVLKQNGYFTSAIVNCVFVGEKFEFDRGFESFVHIPDEQTHTPQPSGVVNRATRWLQAFEGGPFFLFLHLYDIHTDYRSLPRFTSLFVEDYDGPVDGRGEQLRAHMRGELELDAHDARHVTDLYDAEIRQVDDQLDALFRALEQRDLAGNTVVMITSDHGEQLMDHGAFLHGQSQWEEVLHVPLIIRGPGVPAGKRVSEIASLVDIMPTALSLLGVGCPADIDGVDLCSTWRAAEPDWEHRFVFAGGDSGHNGALSGQHDVLKVVRNARYKLHYNRVTDEVALYDLLNDPGETTDVSQRRAAVLKMLRGQLDEHMRASAAQEVSPAKALSSYELQQLKALGYLD